MKMLFSIKTKSIFIVSSKIEFKQKYTYIYRRVEQSYK